MTATLESRLSDKDLLTGNLPYLGKAIGAPLALDYLGLFGSLGAVDSPLTIMATFGAMAGTFSRYRDASILAGLTYCAQKALELTFDYIKDGRINESTPELEKNLATYGLAILAGLGFNYIKGDVTKWSKNLKEKLKRHFILEPKKKEIQVADDSGKRLITESGAAIVLSEEEMAENRKAMDKKYTDPNVQKF